jgi:cephalosporin hydroxylase
MYTVLPDQLDVPDKKKQITKRIETVYEKPMTIEDLRWNHEQVLAEIRELKDRANAIRDELVAINGFIDVKNIPVKV